MLKVYNVLTGKKEEFIPQVPNKVLMYACGITASGEAHIGHAYQAVVFDVIRSYLEYSGYEVKYVRNYTDVDDKIIVKARELGVDPSLFAQEKMKSIDADFAKLGIKPPTIQSKATECIQDIIDFIAKLIDQGCAYPTPDGDVYFRVNSFAPYGSFSHRVERDSQLSGVRKDVEEGKENSHDFALWKKAGDDEIYWESPWGKGRPGWHIECSTMSMKYLGETLDIHGGGKDLIFPHHENEIAQSESLTGKRFANYWIHNGLVKVNGQKMSKSLNNGIILKDVLSEYVADVLKMLLLSNSYRSDLNVVDGMFDVLENRVFTIYKLFEKIDKDYIGVTPDMNNPYSLRIKDDFVKAMDNDFNTALAIANLNKYISELSVFVKKGTQTPEAIVAIKQTLQEVYGVLRLLSANPTEVVESIRNKYLTKNNITKQEVEALLSVWDKARLEKNFQVADEIRAKLTEKNILITLTNGVAGWEVALK